MGAPRASTPNSKAPVAPQTIALECAAGTTREQLISQLSVEGVMANVLTLTTFSNTQMGEGNVVRAAELLRKNISASKVGDLSIADTLLISQATALNTIFNELSRRAALNMGQHLGASETYMRLALKAQSQCRTTLESLAKIKNPPNVAFVKQANIAHGPQQVNNGVGDSPRAQGLEYQPNELNGGDCRAMDSGATGAAVGGNTPVATVGERDRATDRGG